MRNKSNRSGFSLIEIMVAIAVIGILAAIVSPNLRSRQPEYERKQFLGSLNSLMRLARHQAVVTRKLHRVYFNLPKGKAGNVTVQVKSEGKDQKGEQKFATIKAPYLRNSMTWPKDFQVTQFKIERHDEKATGEDEFWFFIVPEGLAQDVVINILDNNKAYRGKPKQIGLVLNPFDAQFKIYDSHQK